MSRSALAGLAGMSLIASVAAAPAAVVWQDSGQLGPGGVSAAIPYLLPGTYRFRWDSEAPLPQFPYSSTFEDLYFYTFNFYFEDGTYYGGDDDRLGQYFDLAPTAAQDPNHFSRIFTVVPLPKDYVIKYPSGAIAETGIYYFVGADINLYPSEDFGAYAASISSVPEPSTWGLLLTGFAALGWAGRFARRAVT